MSDDDLRRRLDEAERRLVRCRARQQMAAHAGADDLTVMRLADEAACWGDYASALADALHGDVPLTADCGDDEVPF